MKLTIKKNIRSGGIRVVQATAVINKSVKLCIPRRYQKTWTVRTVAPDHVAFTSDAMFRAEASRWEDKIMKQIHGEKVPTKSAHVVNDLELL